MCSHLSPSKIAIIGAGPAGCTLARLLLLANIPVKVFEAESSLDIRNQGGTLDLHDDTGLAALKEAGLYDEFLKYARFDGDALSLCDKKMVRYVHVRSTAEGSWFSQRRPEIDRMRLRQLLLNSLPEGIIHWGRRLRRVGPQDLSLHFEDGAAVERGFDLVIGADGAFSKVRPLLTPEQPLYSGLGGYNMIISDAEEKHPLLYRLINRGSMFVFSDGKMVLGQQMGDGSINVTEWGVRRQDWVKEASGNAVKAALREQYRDWSPEVRGLLQAVDDDRITPRLLFMLPVGTRWENRPGVTLLGDAAHLMTPFTGEGVNSAMMDAMGLAHTIIGAIKDGQDQEGLNRRIKIYEQGMFERMTRMQAMTENVMKLMFFTNGAPRTVIERWILAFMSDELNGVVFVFAKMMVYIYYFCFKLFY
jgi:2-polyprenyl-6-methoxyphenol hydroxylase-like FAD-dependent oxidoreductase